MTRRNLIQTAATATGLGKVLPALAATSTDGSPGPSTADRQPLTANPPDPQPQTPSPKPQTLNGRRVLTFNSVIRVNQIEVTRTQNAGYDEYDRHTPENITALRQAFAAGWPGAAMT